MVGRILIGLLLCAVLSSPAHAQPRLVATLTEGADLLQPVPRPFYTFGPGFYQANQPEIPQQVLDGIATLLQQQPIESEIDEDIPCLFPPLTKHVDSMTVSLSNVSITWNNLDVRITYRFSGQSKDQSFSVNGTYDSLWILYVRSPVDRSCRFDPFYEWSDIHQFSANLKGCSGEMEQKILQRVERKVRQAMDAQIRPGLSLLDGQFEKECGAFDTISPVNRAGNVVIQSGKQKTVTVKVANVGESSWMPGQQVGLGLVKDDKSPCFPMLKPGRWYVTQDVKPGRIYSFSLLVTGTDTPMRRQCELQMIRDVGAPGQAPKWFGQIATVDIQVLQPVIKGR